MRASGGLLNCLDIFLYPATKQEARGKTTIHCQKVKGSSLPSPCKPQWTTAPSWLVLEGNIDVAVVDARVIPLVSIDVSGEAHKGTGDRLPVLSWSTCECRCTVDYGGL